MQRLFPNDNYVMVIGSDNGGSADTKDTASNNLPLRGNKGELWEGGIRNHALVWGKHPDLNENKGSTYTGGFMHLVDWHMSLVHLGHATPSASWNPASLPLRSDGMNVWEALTGNSHSPRNDEGLINSYNGFTYRKGKFKISIGAEIGEPGASGSGRYLNPGQFWKVQEQSTWSFNSVLRLSSPEGCSTKPRSDGLRLYNIDDDPAELCDLAASQSQTAVELRREMEEKVSKSEKSNGVDSFPVFDGDCDDASGSGTCSDKKFKMCCESRLKKEKSLRQEKGKTIPGNPCNDGNNYGTGPARYALYPFWEDTGRTRRSVPCDEPAA